MSRNPNVDPQDIDRCEADGPQSTLERMLIEAYLEGKGYSLEGLKELPPELARRDPGVPLGSRHSALSDSAVHRTGLFKRQ